MSTSTLDPRRVLAAATAGLVVIGGLLLAGGLIGGSAGGSDPSSGSRDATSTIIPGSPAASDSDTATPGTDTATSVPAMGDGSAHGSEASAIPPDDLEAAKAVAVEFAVDFSSYRFDEPEAAPLDRVRHLLTADVAAILGDNSGASAERARQADRREVAEANLDSIITGGFDADHVLLNVVVAQRVTSTDGVVEHLLAYQVALGRLEDGWVITGVAIS